MQSLLKLWGSGINVENSTFTIYWNYKELGKVSKLGKWVPQQLTEKQRIKCANIADPMLTVQHPENYLTVITGDEKNLIFCEDIKKKI